LERDPVQARRRDALKAVGAGLGGVLLLAVLVVSVTRVNDLQRIVCFGREVGFFNIRVAPLDIRHKPSRAMERH